MKRVSLFLSIVLLLTLWSCNENKKDLAQSKAPSDVSVEDQSSHLINATLWVQQSSEYYACCYQAFNYAKLALDYKLKNLKNSNKPLAVVLDVDETILDNSYYEAHLIASNTSYTKDSWKEWTDKQSATAVPGAIDFLKYVKSQNVEIIYISNRRDHEQEASFNNMKALGFPEVPLDNYYFRTDESSKVNRRKVVSETYDIVLLLGDNIADFDGVFEGNDLTMLKNTVSDNQDRFGTDFIILPNPMYGTWERALPVDETKTDKENRIEALKGY